MKPFLPLLAALLLFGQPTVLRGESSRQIPIENPGFEEGAPGSSPAPWFLTVPGQGVEGSGQIDDSEPFAGRQSARLRRKGPPVGDVRLYQEKPAESLRGRRLRLHLAVRAARASDNDHWIRPFLEMQRAGKEARTLVDDAASPIWKEAEIYLDLPPDAERVRFGLIARGDAEGWMDTVSLEDVGPAGEGNEPAHPLSLRGRINLLAYLHLIGAVRYFHPSDQAADLDWDHFLLATVGPVERAGNAAELAALFSRLFRPIAPTVRFFRTGKVVPRTLLPRSPGARLVSWLHHGLETRAPRSHFHFRSARVGGFLPEIPADLSRGMSSLASRAAASAVRKPAVLDLGGGVSAVVPVALYRDRQGTLPHRRSVADPFLGTKPRGFEPSGDDRSTRLADVLLLGAALENFYPYPDARPALRQALEQALAAAAEDPDERRFLDTLRRVTHSLGDGHAEVTHASDPRFSHLPLLWAPVAEGIVVTQVAPGLPEVRPGDRVLEIDGKEAGAAIASAEALVSGASAGDLRWRALEFLASGSRGEEHHLRLLRGEGAPFDMDLRCTLPAFGAGRLRRTTPKPVAEVAPGILYLDIGRIDNEGFSAALPRLAPARGVIFDFRGYPEKLETPLLLGRLLPHPATVRSATEVRTRPDWPATLEVHPFLVSPLGEALSTRAVFLIDERAVSRAEFTLQYVAENHLGTLLGSPTAGTQGEIDEMVLPGGYHALWTGTQVLRADGTPFRGVGIVPDLAVRPSQAGVAAERDEVLDAAVALLSASLTPRKPTPAPGAHGSGERRGGGRGPG